MMSYMAWCVMLQAAVEEAKKDCRHSMPASQIHSMLQTTIAAVKSDVRLMVIYL